ncbi:MFS transporter [Gephyromycinifex aptenodytis]|uniref:MFS transporter n=1 Tax=Gephyromycinifex aptenodytis TaxID=2716227 RepID=UPI0014469F7C|nr:MFS transporter [Gephyromycinifex aptenodytis]
MASATFRSFTGRNFRLFFLGALVSNVGTWMGRTAQAWLVLVELTEHSAPALGLVTALQFLPMVLLAPWAGLIADRFAKRRILTLTQGSMALIQLVTGLLIITGTATLALVYLLTFLLGAASAIDAPARQAFVSEVVGPDLLSNAIGLNSANFNAARLVGPGLAGLLIAVIGTGGVFLLSAVTFAAIITSLWAMNPALIDAAPKVRGRGRLREGLTYVAHRPDILLIFAIVFLLGTFGMNFQMTTALMATTVYERGPKDYGILGSVMAVGSLAAALLAARRSRPRLRTILLALAAFALANTAAALAPSYELFAVLLVPVGLAALTVLPTANSIVQLAVEPEMRGRVMSLYMAIFMGGTPVGAPLLGWVGERYGARWTLLAGSLAAVLALVIALVHLVGFGGVRVRYRRGVTPRFAVTRVGATPHPEVTP